MMWHKIAHLSHWPRKPCYPGSDRLRELQYVIRSLLALLAKHNLPVRFE